MKRILMVFVNRSRHTKIVLQLWQTFQYRLYLSTKLCERCEIIIFFMFLMQRVLVKILLTWQTRGCKLNTNITKFLYLVEQSKLSEVYCGLFFFLPHIAFFFVSVTLLFFAPIVLLLSRIFFVSTLNII